MMARSPYNMSEEESVLMSICNISSFQNEASVSTCLKLLRQSASLSNQKSHDSTLWMVTIVAVAFFVVGFCFNLFLILVIIRGPGFRRPVWILICNLTVADMTVLLSMMAFIIYAHKRPSLPPNIEVFLFPSIDMFVSNASMLAVASVAVNQAANLLVTKWSLAIASKSAAKVVASLIWFYSGVIFVLSCLRMRYAANKSYQRFVIWFALMASFVLAVATTAVAVLVLAIGYIRSWKRIVPNGKPTSVSKPRVRVVFILPDAIAKSRSTKKVANALLTVLAPLPFLCGWSFFLAVNAYELIVGKVLEGEILNLCMLLVPWAVSACNPILFLLLTAALRREVFRTIKSFVARTCGKPKYDRYQLTLLTDVNTS